MERLVCKTSLCVLSYCVPRICTVESDKGGNRMIKERKWPLGRPFIFISYFLYSLCFIFYFYFIFIFIFYIYIYCDVRTEYLYKTQVNFRLQKVNECNINSNLLMLTPD
jgi:amino acid transporter